MAPDARTDQGTEPPMSKKAKYVVITLMAGCECGHTWELQPSDVYKQDGEMSESGTYWPGEFTVTCPKCKGAWDANW